MTYTHQAHMITQFGGTTFKQASSLEDGIIKARAHKNPTSKITIVRRWVTDTKGNILWETDR